MRALLFFDRGLDPHLVLLALLFHVGANLGNLLVQLGELGLHRAQPRLGILGHLARRLDIVAQRLRALAKDLGENLRPAECQWPER